jgi:hypothetical protein
MAKAKRYNGEDGSVTEGQNAGIDDDTRARAMKWVQEQSDSAETEESTPAAKTTTKATKTAKTESKAERKGASVDDEAGRSRGRPAEGAPKGTMGANPPRARTRAELIDAIPTGGKKGAGPTESKGNSASGSELGRTITNTANALTPGIGRAVRGATATAKGVNELVASRKAAAAAQAAREAREAKTLNPAAWMAGPKGMKENFKSGGGVKGWGIARGSRKAKTY